MAGYWEAFKATIKCFEEIEQSKVAKYMLVGGVLTPLYAEVRQTQDFDFVIELEMSEANLHRLQQLFVKYKFQPFNTWKEAFSSGLMRGFLTRLSPIEQFKVDINIKKETPENTIEQLRIISFPRRVRIKMRDVECWAQTKEDFILVKLVYGGYQDYKDALSCFMRFKERLDRVFLNKEAQELGVQEYLHAIIEQKPVDAVFPE